jgi:hypothetical protein
VADKQLGLGCHHALCKRSTLDAELTCEMRDKLPSDRQSTGWDIGIKHNF